MIASIVAADAHAAMTADTADTAGYWENDQITAKPSSTATFRTSNFGNARGFSD